MGATLTEQDMIRSAKQMPEAWQNLGYHELNAMLNLYGPDGRIQFEADPVSYTHLTLPTILLV